MKTPFEIYMEQVKLEREQFKKDLAARGIKVTSANLGNGPAHDYGKGPGNWTGD